ncbi:MAG: ATP-binding protein, partial [Alphaproteobacteria bacterium]|nr:ATP-binding protein [Alphaproteobacteria bacterium]
APTDLDSLVAALCEDAADAGQPVRFTGGCGRIVRTRPQALQRCLANLVDNAVKHAGVAALSCARTEGRVVVAVRDHGPGLPPDRIDALFEPFARLDPSRSRDSGGVGLGLTIARRMAERAGATLTLANHPESGLIAEVSLPA